MNDLSDLGDLTSRPPGILPSRESHEAPGPEAQRNAARLHPVAVDEEPTRSPQPEPPETAPPAPKSKRKAVIAVSVALLLAAAGAALILMPRKSESTDSAYLRADGTVVAAQVKGRVTEVLVRDNQQVKAGTPLLRIEAEEFDARVALAAAEVQNARAAVASAGAALATLDAEEQLAESNIQAVETSIRAANAQLTRATHDQARFEALVATGAVAARDAESANAAAQVARAEADRSRAAMLVSGNQAALTRS
jgi:membrane fusion protein (multidrug efflux system)